MADAYQAALGTFMLVAADGKYVLMDGNAAARKIAGLIGQVAFQRVCPHVPWVFPFLFYDNPHGAVGVTVGGANADVYIVQAVVG